MKISVLIDESTTLSRKSTLVIVIRTYFEDYPSGAYVFNLDLIELTNTTSESITNQLLSCLHKHGFEQTFLKECFIASACDGASVMLGKNKGVAKRLQSIFPNLVIWHCSNYRLELAVNDCVNEEFYQSDGLLRVEELLMLLYITIRPLVCTLTMPLSIRQGIQEKEQSTMV